jgi:hypothetical protein
MQQRVRVFAGCVGTCRIRKGRGADLAYLTALPPDQARA